MGFFIRLVIIGEKEIRKERNKRECKVKNEGIFERNKICKKIKKT